MHTAIADKKAKLIELCRQYNVARLEVFGSAARGTDFDPQTQISWLNSNPKATCRPSICSTSPSLEHGKCTVLQVTLPADGLGNNIGRSRVHTKGDSSG